MRAEVAVLAGALHRAPRLGGKAQPSSEAVFNPTYGQAVARTLPTSVRFALKVGF
jgi:hypothetical protein